MKKQIVRCLLKAVARTGDSTGKSRLVHYHKDGHDFSILWEYSQYYGDIARQWVIDGNMLTDVENRFCTNRMLMYDCSERLCGVREIPISMSYEFLCKPLGIDWETHADTKNNLLERHKLTKWETEIVPDWVEQIRKGERL